MLSTLSAVFMLCILGSVVIGIITKNWKISFLGMSIFMTGLAIVTGMQSDMFHLNPIVLHEPWFTTTLVDFYDNITIISFWVVYKENNWLKSILWIVAFIILGSIGTGFYVFLQLTKLRKGQTFEDILCRRSSR
jgi:hypothetical protein